MTEDDEKRSLEQNLRDYLERFMSAPRPGGRRPARGGGLLLSIASAVVVAGLIAAGGLALANHRGTATPRRTTTTASPPTTSTPVPTATPAPSSSPSAQACLASQLRLTLVQRNPSNAQQASAILGLTNVSTATCELDGYPTVALYGDSGQHLNVALARGGIFEIQDPGEQVVLLSPGGTGAFGIGWIIVDGPNIGPNCVDAARLQVTLPNPSGTLDLSISINQICPPGPHLPQIPQLNVTAIGPEGAFSG